MNELRGRKVPKIESPVPGCLGRMVNLFDLGTAVNGNKLLTDKPHRDVSSLSRSRSDVTRTPSPSYKSHSEADLAMSGLRRSVSGNIPMKKLIAREMSKEVEQKQSPTNVVAKLMGLETLPQTVTKQQTKSRSHSMTSMDTEVQNYQNLSREFKDVFETWQSPQKVSRSRDSSPRKGRYDEMALVRQKFTEVKRLVTDSNLHQSEEFQDALEVLSSNKDLFVKYLQESNSFASNYQHDHPQTHSEAKRITVLRPSKVVETEKFVAQGRKDKQVKKFASSSQEHIVQPTRIVVLKPSLGKSQDRKAVTCFDEPGDIETKEVAKEITRQVRENLMGHRRNETQSSSVLSNGYIGDDSSFDNSINEDQVEELSDSDIMSPVSRHSWDCPNRFESLFSPSSYSRASFSPESSSVGREAKKRLSERWALMSTTRSTQPVKHVQRSSSTLGEMLALSETKVTTTASREESNEITAETRASTSCITSDMSLTSDSLNILARSNSVPDVRLNGDSSVSTKAQAPHAPWKVSNLFFFKNKKVVKEKKDGLTPSSVTLPGKTDCLFPDASQQSSIIPEEEEEQTTPKPLTAGNTSEDQPSPNSVLFPPFEEESINIPECSGSAKLWTTTTQGEDMCLKSNLIDKSPPIGSIARILSWNDDSCTEHATRVHEDEDWFIFIETILTAAGLTSGCCNTVSHDANNRLDASLRDKYTNADDNNVNEGKRRQQRSTRKLIFDRISSILTETTMDSDSSTPFDLVEHVWVQIKEWFLDDSVGDEMAAESLVKEEIVGKTWMHSLQLEVDEFGIDIERRLLQELVEEAVIDLTR